MRKIIAIWICAILIGSLGTGVAASLGEQPEILRVASTTAMSGRFFTDMWGNNTADIDVRTLIHGYATVAWADMGDCIIDPTVVMDTNVTNASGNRTYEFTLQKELTYNDGTPITARDYVFSVLMLSDPRVTSLGSIPATYGHLLGFEKYGKTVETALAKNSEEPIQVPFSGVRLLDEYRFSVTIAKGSLPYFYELSLVQVQPYPMQVIAPGCEIADDGKGAYISGPFDSKLVGKTVLDKETGYLYYPRVTSGPYTLLSYDAETHTATFERNEQYLGNYEGAIPVFEKIEYTLAHPATMLTDLEAGKIDILHKISSGERIAQGLELTHESKIRTQNYLRAGFGHLSFACEQGVTASVNVRKAIAMCVDTEAFCQDVLGGFGVPVYSYYGLGQWMASESQMDLLGMAQNSLNINAARQALEKDGWTLNIAGEAYDAEMGGTRYRKAADGTLEELVIKWAVPEGTEIAGAMVEMLRENAPLAGIRVEAEIMSFDELLAHYYRQADRTYDMFFSSSNFLLAFDPYYTFHTDDEYQGVFNTTGLKDKKLMQLAEAMRKTTPDDKESYREKWLKFQARWIELLPAVPLYSNIYFDFFRQDLQGYAPNSNWSWAKAILSAYVGEPPEEDSVLDAAFETDDEEFSDAGDIVVMEGI